MAQYLLQRYKGVGVLTKDPHDKKWKVLGPVDLILPQTYVAVELPWKKTQGHPKRVRYLFIESVEPTITNCYVWGIISTDPTKNKRARRPKKNEDNSFRKRALVKKKTDK
jgi:hypothetical protein